MSNPTKALTKCRRLIIGLKLTRYHRVGAELLYALPYLRLSLANPDARR